MNREVSVRRMLFLALAVATGALPAAAAAQDTAIVIHPESAGIHFAPVDLPRAVAEEALQRYNAKTTIRLVSRTRLPAGAAWRGDVVIRNGPALIGGRIEGSLTVINGNAVLDSTAAITGDLLVIGGTVTGPQDSVGGPVRIYGPPLPYKVSGDTLIYSPDLWRKLRLSAHYTFGQGETKTSLLLATSGTYNRVEALPIVVGPSLDWRIGGSTWLYASAVGVFRTARSLSGECCNLGYNVRGELRAGDRRTVSLSFRSFDLVTPVEDWGLHANEVGWAAFLFHRDYRDYYRNNGWLGRLAWQAEPPLGVSLEYRYEHQRSVTARDPWTLFRSEEDWRPNPPIDEGHYYTISPGLTIDSRNDRDHPTSGLYFRGTLDFSQSNDASPHPLPPSVRDSIPANGSYTFTRAWLDLRSYFRLSQSGRLSARFILGGWAGGDPLPLQRRLSIGGTEPLPGYEFRQVSCSENISDPAFAGTSLAACDRVISLQMEYRGRLSIFPRYNPETGQAEGMGVVTRFLRGPDFVVLGDAGQAWLVGEGPGHIPSDHIPALDSWLADLGVGIDWGGLGVYLAKAVTGNEPFRFTVRLEHRF